MASGVQAAARQTHSKAALKEVLVFFHCESSSIVNHLVKNRPGPGRRRGDGLQRPHGRVPCHLAVK